MNTQARNGAEVPRRIALLLVAAVLLPACGSTDDPDPEPTAEEPTATAEEEATEEPTSTATDDPSATADGDGLFTEATLCVPDGPDDETCLDADGAFQAACTLEWSPAAEDVLAGEGELSYELLYEDDPILTGSAPYSTIRDAEGALATPLEITLGLGGLPFASGAYECRVDDGQAPIHATATVDAGPSEPVYGMAVCDFDDAVAAGPTSICVDHVDAFVDVTHLNCSGALARLGDDGLRAEMVWVPPADSQPFLEHSVHLNIEPTGSPLHALNIHVDASAFGAPGEERAAGEPLPTGEYTCRFSQGEGQPPLAETTVTVTES